MHRTRIIGGIDLVSSIADIYPSIVDGLDLCWSPKLILVLYFNYLLATYLLD